MKWGVIVFPGSNCALDAYHLAHDVLGLEARYIDYRSADLDGCEALILPGGFTYGDYLRPGALARFSPVMDAVGRFAAAGGPVLGICNGFQVLTEAGLLPGALYRNRHLQFRCQPVYLRVENNRLPFTAALEEGAVLKMPVAHGDGSYYAPPVLLEDLEENGQVVFRYCGPDGVRDAGANPNGSLADIAGVCNRAGNVLGMMPHPERAGEAILGSTDGLAIFQSLHAYLRERKRGLLHER